MPLRYIAGTGPNLIKSCYDWGAPPAALRTAHQMSAPTQCAAALLGLACVACLFVAEGATVSAYSDPRNNVCPSADWRVRFRPHETAGVQRKAICYLKDTSR